MLSEIQKLPTTALKSAIKTMESLRIKDFIASQHLMNLLMEFDKERLEFSLLAYKNIEIINDVDKGKPVKTDLYDLSLKLRTYNMYLDKMKSPIYRNLIEESEIKRLELPVTVFNYDNVDLEYLKFSDRKDNYLKTFNEISQMYLNEHDKRNTELNYLYDKIGFIASIGFSEKLLLKIPILKTFVRKKYKV